MDYKLIRKPRSGWDITPNLVDYEAERLSFSWEAARKQFDRLPTGGLNIAHEAIDRHASGTRGDHVALRWIGKAGEIHDYTYARMRELTNRFANVLQSLEVGKGECVFVLIPRIPELYITALGTLKNRSVFCPLFSAFGPEPIHTRMAIGKAKVLVTTEALYRRKVRNLRDSLPHLQHVLLVGEDSKPADQPNTFDFHRLMNAADPHFMIASTDPEDMALLHFTSGTTGKPKGVVHVHAAIIAHHATGKIALDLHAGDICWCTADPGWVTGTSYGIIAPLAVGATLLVDREEFDIERWYSILQKQKVTVWYTSPTAVRMLMKGGLDLAHEYDPGKLRFMASVGEALNPEAVLWGLEAFGLPFHDNWWQTETGGIMVANYQSMVIKPGSMGRPIPGIEVAIVRRTRGGGVKVLETTNQLGELAIRSGWPSMFRAYLGEEERYRICFADGWYLTGDLARQDQDGYFWFVGRADDVIKSAGHLIGPFEVESTLMEHPSVVEAGVIGVPDPLVGEIVKAFVTLKPDYDASETLRRELLGHARRNLGPAVAPREIDFRVSLPKNRSGKIMRRLLRARELGLEEGDISTLEGNE